MEPKMYFDEEEEEDEEWENRLRHEVIEFILRRYGIMSANDIARALGWKVVEVTRVLRSLETAGRVKKTKLGKASVWTHMEEYHQDKMYY
ncbi:MAG: hypothetical protein QXG10_00225 [Candidatus Hadarchaeales archaeon]